MRYFVISILSVLSYLPLSATAANVTVKWFGVVPSLDCASRPISNQVDFKALNKECNSEFKIESQSEIEHKGQSKKIVSFNV